MTKDDDLDGCVSLSDHQKCSSIVCQVCHCLSVNSITSRQEDDALGLRTRSLPHQVLVKSLLKYEPFQETIKIFIFVLSNSLEHYFWC